MTTVAMVPPTHIARSVQIASTAAAGDTCHHHRYQCHRHRRVREISAQMTPIAAHF